MKQNELTTKDYFRAGALIRMCHYLLEELYISPAIMECEQCEQNVYRMSKMLDVTRFRVVASLSDDFLCLEDDPDMFFGATNNKPHTREDAEVVEQMREIVREMLGENVYFLGA